MKVRAVDKDGDYQLGRPGIFHIDTPKAVAAAVASRFALWQGEWFLDDREGTPYLTEIIGYGTHTTRDLAIKERVIETPGVLSIEMYSSSVEARTLTASFSVQTVYGTAVVNL